jgi:hypothetical protein
MSNKMITTNISLPREDWKALKILAAQQEVSMANLVRKSLKQSIARQAKKLIQNNKITVNGFTVEFEEQVLKAATEPINKARVWKTSADIDKYFDKLRSKRTNRK